MKKIIRTFFCIALATCIWYPVIAQRENDELSTLWIPLEGKVPCFKKGDRLMSSNSRLQKLIDEHQIKNIKKAFPDAWKQELILVYEITCHCNVDDLIKDISKNDW